MDRLNPRRYSGIFRGPYHARAIQALEPLRLAAGYEPRNEVIPDQSNQVLGARAAYDHRVTVPPGSYLWALSGSSEQPEGFTVQITDFATRSNLLSAPAKFENITGQGTFTLRDAAGAQKSLWTPLHLLAAPRPLIEPGLLNVQLTNSSNNQNRVQLVLWILRPPAAGAGRNSWNAELEAEVELWRRARGRAAAGPAGPTVTTSEPEALPVPQDPALKSPAKNQPFNVGAAGDNVLIAGTPGYRIAVHQLTLWNTGQQHIRLLDRDIDLQGPLTDFPANTGYMLPYQDEPHFVLIDGNPLVANLSAGSALTGFIKYRLLKIWTPGGNL
jgi:hypothetical protein